TDVSVVRPGNNNEVLEIMKIANEKNVLVRPVGLRTVCTAHKPRKVRPELVGKKGIIIDMTRMNRIIEVSEETMTVTVEAGTTMAEINTALAPKGYRVIEGTLAPYCATAGALVGYGPGANKYGSRQDQVVDLQVVTPTGALLQTGAAGLGMLHFDRPSLCWYPLKVRYACWSCAKTLA
ncbi:MAG: FAD-dependent oxidoreductase, partial [Candidatus Bathyarchaeota archaeon]|nr:FAD-dependent oxidoreductase [Candidatus Bathyarchaeota archaeon]